MNPIAPVLPAPNSQVLAMVLSDVRATLAQTQAAQAAGGAQPADVVLDLSAAAQQMLGS
jgi:hypothetical protein